MPAVREDLFLDLLQVPLDLGLDVDVLVDHGVEDGVEDRDGAQAEPVGVGLEARPDVLERARLAPADRDDEPVTDEEHDLAGLDVGRRLDVAQRLEDGEHRPVVALDLPPLTALDRVLDRERVQLELVVDDGELAVRGVLQTDPDERARVLVRADAGELVTEVLAGTTLAVPVHRLVDDHGGHCPCRQHLP